MSMSNDAADAQARAHLASLTGAGVLARRGFVLGSASAGFAAAVAPAGPLLAQTIQTDASGLIQGDVRIPAGADRIPAYMARPANGKPRSTVLVVQEIFGVHEHIRDVCRRFAHQGYLAIAPEMFFRIGDPRSLPGMAEIISQIVAKVPDDQVLADLDACAQWAQGQGSAPGQLGITGFCWGGRIVWLYAAHRKDLKAGVAWYGRLTGPQNALTPLHPVQVADRLNAPVLGLYGAADSGIPLDTVEDMKDRLSVGDKFSQASRFVVYPDTPHAFHADYRPSYRAGPARDGWTRCLAWFREYGLAP